MHAVWTDHRAHGNDPIPVLACNRGGDLAGSLIVRAQQPGHLIGNDPRSHGAQGLFGLRGITVVATKAD